MIVVEVVINAAMSNSVSGLYDFVNIVSDFVDFAVVRIDCFETFLHL